MGRGRIIDSSEWSSRKEEMAVKLRKAFGKVTMIPGKIGMAIDIPISSRLDIDSPEKWIVDCCEGFFFKEDNMVYTMNKRKWSNNYFLVFIQPIDN